MYTTYDIFDDILGLRSNIEKYFNDLAPKALVIEYPYINLYDRDDTITLRALIPGIKADELDIQLVDTTLLIEGERKSDYVDKPYVRRERDFGKFKKSITLPYRVDRDSITATMKDGVLTVTLRKSPEAMPKKIQIQ